MSVIQNGSDSIEFSAQLRFILLGDFGVGKTTFFETVFQKRASSASCQV
jgi:septin family protein